MVANMTKANTAQKLQQGKPTTAEEALRKLVESPNDKPSISRQDWLAALGWTKNKKDNKYNAKTKSMITSEHQEWAKRFNSSDRWTAKSDDEAVLNELLSCNPKTNEPNYTLEYLLAKGNDGVTILHTVLEPFTYQEDAKPGRKPSPIEFHLDRLKPLIRFLLLLQPELPATKSKNGPPLVMALRVEPTIESGDKSGNDQDDAKDQPGEKTQPVGEDQPEATGHSYIGFSPSTKAQIVRFMCKKSNDRLDCLGSQAAVRSLGDIVTWTDEDNEIIKSARPVIYEAIESADFTIDEEVLKEISKVKVEVEAQSPKDSSKMELRPCLEVLDKKARTCLHWVLTFPLDEKKIWWATKIAELQPRLLQTTTCETKVNGRTKKVTPLQYLSVQKALHQAQEENEVSRREESDLGRLQDVLKLQCISEFDDITACNIMYTRDNARSLFLTLEDQTVSFESLNAFNSHYKLDVMLKRVEIHNNVSIHWDDASAPMRKEASRWAGAGSIDLYLVFHWLKQRKGADMAGVKKIIQVVVEDGVKPDSGGADSQELREHRQHSDRVIVECLKDLDVEVFDWRRLDIPADVIVEAAGKSVKTVYLYCSGLRAVLQSWADQNGLARLEEVTTASQEALSSPAADKEQLEEVKVQINQGLDSLEHTREYGEKFKRELKLTWARAQRDARDERNRKRPDLLIKVKVVPRKKTVATRSSASKLKSADQEGFEEQDWVKCMDEFADALERIEPETPLPGRRPIRVALIDDGVKTSYAALDHNIHTGRSGWQRVERITEDGRDKGKSTTTRYRSYNSSHTGHGTVMAYYIRRVCPNVKFCVAKLEPQPQGRKVDGQSERVSFTLESAAEAIEWAVQEDVDIISTSWAIDEQDASLMQEDKLIRRQREERLRQAIQLAADKDILLFCANPDKGAVYTKNKTYPWVLSQSGTSINIFCIGAATQEKVSWPQISDKDDSCDYLLPGVNLGIQVEGTSSKNTENPPEKWQQYSGSSLSCALAAGLAAMILHCALLSGEVTLGDPKWKWLRTAQGMRNAFTRIQLEGSTDQTTSSKWLPVRNLFRKVASQFLSSSIDTRDSLMRELVKKLLVGMRPETVTRESNMKQ